MPVRDMRRHLRGHFLEGNGELVIRDVDRSAHCQRCGGRLDMRTQLMTGQLVEECRSCGTSRPVQRFLPTGEEPERRHRRRRT